MPDRSVHGFIGAPPERELALRRTLRGLQLAVAIPATVVLWWAGSWAWLPIPLAASFLVYEASLASRRDLPTALRLGPDGVELEDALRGQRQSMAWSEVEVATATRHRVPRGSEVVVMLADRGGPRLALRFLVRTASDGAGVDVDLDRVDALLGGVAGALPTVHAVASFDGIGRQRFEDPRALALLRELVHASAWERAGMRTWTGEAPPLDPYGYQLREPDGWLLLEQDRWCLRAAGTGELAHEGTLRGVALGVRSRTAHLTLRPGDAPTEVGLPLAALILPDGPRILFPTRARAGEPLPVPGDPTDLHTHFPEGAAMVRHLLRHLAPSDVPPTLLSAASSAGPLTASPAPW